MINVLIVDDSRVVRKLIRNVLEKNDFNCLEAENGIDALEKLVLNDIDIIMADLNMPKMSGYELIKSIRSNDIYNDIPILMLTTETNEQDKKNCLEAGANVYLAKPLPPAEMVEEIKKFLK